MSKIRVGDLAKYSPDRMTKVAVASTTRVQLDLYCVAPGQSQKAHAHADLDKIYYVLEGAGQFSLGGTTETLGPGEALVAPQGVEHGLDNVGPHPLLVLVVVAPPPTR
ncbi:MAG: cupin domain-containing protein [Candidatus Rokubacteria bacterium]|nr:cupin domain-containing protein [Candidatus Rokubacteria bacterium]